MQQVREKLAQLGDLLSREGEVVVTRLGRPIARLLPVLSPRAMPSHEDLRASMPRLQYGSEEHVHTEPNER